MCVNYQPPKPDQFDYFKVTPPSAESWPDETWQDYAAPIILAAKNGERNAILATYGMVPKNRIPANVKKYTTMNARAESVGSLRSYSQAWNAAQLCLVPMQWFYEPNWESGKHVRWKIGMSDGAPFAVAGIWRSWPEKEGQHALYSFTQLTVNADNHDLMKHFHRPGDEKRSLVVVPEEEYDSWLTCNDPEIARSFMTLYPPKLMSAEPAPREAKQK